VSFLIHNSRIPRRFASRSAFDQRRETHLQPNRRAVRYRQQLAIGHIDFDAIESLLASADSLIRSLVICDLEAGRSRIHRMRCRERIFSPAFAALQRLMKPCAFSIILNVVGRVTPCAAATGNRSARTE